MLVHGLYGLLLAFYDACESVLARNLPDKWGNFLRSPGNCSEHGPVRLDPSKAALLESDADLAFIIESFDGDLFQGLQSVEVSLAGFKASSNLFGPFGGDTPVFPFSLSHLQFECNCWQRCFDGLV
mmetsp:Transcript_17440/g.48161  ORF Transcript_17440/g.48161 Transcript_17440/m.48161 type:complete len:126 (-) Transcript_17440:66-443(-)